MAAGYGPNEISLALFLCLFTQIPLFLLLVTRGYQALTSAWSSRLCAVFGMVATTASSALYTAMFPLFGIGWTSGIITVFGIVPLTILNSLILTVRAFMDRPKGLALVLTACVVPLNLAFWALLVLRAGS